MCGALERVYIRHLKMAMRQVCSRMTFLIEEAC
jgi:hypothetical protein